MDLYMKHEKQKQTELETCRLSGNTPVISVRLQVQESRQDLRYQRSNEFADKQYLLSYVTLFTKLTCSGRVMITVLEIYKLPLVYSL